MRNRILQGDRLEYLAIPYSHPDPKIRKERFELANRIASELMKGGRLIYSPISHSHPIAQYGLPLDWEYWQRIDRLYLSFCSRLIVIKADGWEVSRGIREEIKIFCELGKGDQIEFRIP